MMLNKNLQRKWNRFWMRFAGTNRIGKVAASLSALGMPPFYGRSALCRYNKNGYISPHATIYHRKLKIGRHVYIDDNVMIYQDKGGEKVEIGDHVHLYRDTVLQNGLGGHLTIGESAHIQPRCQFSAYKGPIVIGQRAEIAPACAFYSYNHGMSTGMPIREQPISTKGGITLDDDVWLGYGVVVLDGVHIGRGAVVGAGSVVTKSIQADGMAVGNPARVIKMRGE